MAVRIPRRQGRCQAARPAAHRRAGPACDTPRRYCADRAPCPAPARSTAPSLDRLTDPALAERDDAHQCTAPCRSGASARPGRARSRRDRAARPARARWRPRPAGRAARRSDSAAAGAAAGNCAPDRSPGCGIAPGSASTGVGFGSGNGIPQSLDHRLEDRDHRLQLLHDSAR